MKKFFIVITILLMLLLLFSLGVYIVVQCQICPQESVSRLQEERNWLLSSLEQNKQQVDLLEADILAIDKERNQMIQLTIPIDSAKAASLLDIIQELKNKLLQVEVNTTGARSEMNGLRMKIDSVQAAIDILTEGKPTGDLIGDYVFYQQQKKTEDSLMQAFNNSGERKSVIEFVEMKSGQHDWYKGIGKNGKETYAKAVAIEVRLTRKPGIVPTDCNNPPTVILQLVELGITQKIQSGVLEPNKVVGSVSYQANCKNPRSTVTVPIYKGIKLKPYTNYALKQEASPVIIGVVYFQNNSD